MNSSNDYSLITIILDFGQATKAIKLVKTAGATGGTVVLGRGTVRSSILSMLGLDESRREVVLVGIESRLEEKAYEILRQELELDKPDHGIVFSIPIRKAIGKKFIVDNSKSEGEGDNHMDYEAIFTIVNKGMADRVLESAKAAGSTGGTVIHGRGSSTEATEKLFNLEIEPEKDIVMILSRREHAGKITEAINKTVGIEDEGNGIIFVLDVSKAFGLYGGAAT